MYSYDVFRSFQSLPLTRHSSFRTPLAICLCIHPSLSLFSPARHLTPTPTITAHHTSRPIRPSLYFVPSVGLVAGGCQPRSPRGHHLSVPLSLICTRGRASKREDGWEQCAVLRRGQKEINKWYKGRLSEINRMSDCRGMNAQSYIEREEGYYYKG